MRAAAALAGVVAAVLASAPARAAPPGPAPAPGSAPGAGGAIDIRQSRLTATEYKGRPVEDVQIRGNAQVSSTVIRNLIRTKAGEPFDPATVIEDYQRVFGLRKFANVQALVEPTAAGVIVTFVVTEQRQINTIRFTGVADDERPDLRNVIDVRQGEAIDSFRIAVSRRAIEDYYREKNFPLAHVTTPEEPLAARGELVFNIVKGPNARVRKVDFKGARSFTVDKLRDQVKTGAYVFIFNAGKFNPQQVEDDVASVRRFYDSNGFFDVRVGRKIIWSPDLTEIQVDFLVDEGPRYTIDKVSFTGNQALTDAELRARLRLTEGRPWDQDTLQRDVREIVRTYSAKGLGYIYQPGSEDPAYFRIDPKRVFRPEPGKVELVYDIHEGERFRVGNIFVKGNYKSQDKLVLREFRDLVPGTQFNSAELQDSTERLRRLPYFGGLVQVTPIGDQPGVRDLLVEVTEARTAQFNIGAGVNSNGGVGANITYEQRNFDIGNMPSSWDDVLSDRAFTGAGQVLRISLEPGTIQSNAGVRFTEPYVFDLPFSFTNDFYLRTRVREHYDDQRLGDQVTIGHRFDYVHAAAVSLRWEQVDISDIENDEVRAQDILDAEGGSQLSSIALQLRRDTTNPGLFPYRGHSVIGRAEFYGALGGDYSFQKFTLSYDHYFTLAEDLLERKTVLALRGNVGYITGDSVFFERFYGGGIGSVRGFEFRGISPRQGLDEDPIGGDFSVTGTAEIGFPLYGESLRGVVFTDVGTVEEDFELGNMRSSVGAGVRLVLPFLGQIPVAIDFAVPLTKEDEDDTQIFSFSFGFFQ